MKSITNALPKFDGGGGVEPQKIKLTIKADFTNHENNSIELNFAEREDIITLDKFTSSITVETYPNVFFNIISNGSDESVYYLDSMISTVFDFYDLAVDYINEKWGYTLVYPSLTPSEDYTLELSFY